MIERTKAKSGFKQGVHVRGVSDNLKHQHAHNRIGKRDEITKRFRRSSGAPSAEVFSSQALHSAVLAIQSSDQSLSLAGISTLRHFLCSEDPPVEAVVNTGVIDDLARILSLEDQASIPDAIWCLTNIATGNHAQTGAVIRAVPALLNILSRSTSAAAAAQPNLCEEVCWAIGNIAGDSDEYRAVLLQYGTLQPIVDFLLYSLNCLHTSSSAQSDVPSTVFSRVPSSSSVAGQHQSRARTAIWAISNMARGSSPGAVFLNSGVTGPLLDLLRKQPSVDVQTEVCWLFAFLTAKEDETVAALMEQGLAHVMVAVAASSSPSLMSTVPCVRVLVNMSSGPLQWRDALFALPALLPALVLLSDVTVAQKAVGKESILLLRNLLGSDVTLREGMFRSPSRNPLLWNIVKALLSDQFDLQIEAVSALNAACLDADASVHSVFVTADVLRQVIHLLKAPDVDLNMECVAALRILVPRSPVALSICTDLGLYDTLDDIQYGPGDPMVRGAARQMVDDFFETVEEEEQASPAQYTFGLPSGSAESQSAPSPPSVGRGSHLLRPAWMAPN